TAAAEVAPGKSASPATAAGAACHCAATATCAAYDGQPQAPATSRLGDVTETATPGEVEILIQLLDHELPPPSYAHPGDAGLDLHAREDVELEPGARAAVPTGVAIALPEGYAGLVHPRSGLA